MNKPILIEPQTEAVNSAPPAVTLSPSLFNQRDRGAGVVRARVSAPARTQPFSQMRAEAATGKIPHAFRRQRQSLNDEESLTPEQFLALAVDVITAGFNQDQDVPELWSALSRFPKDDQMVLGNHIRHAPLPVGFGGRAHPQARSSVDMVLRLIDFHAGLIDSAALHAGAEALFLRNGQAPLAAGYFFHVRRLLDPGNPIYDLSRRTCQLPFQHFHVLENGSHLCCASWLKKSIGKLSTTPHQQVWNSHEAVSIRESVMDGTFRYCNKIACPYISNGSLPTKEKLREDPTWDGILTRGSGRIDLMPVHVRMDYDRQCNLACPSCRTGYIINNAQRQVQMEALTEAVYPLLASAEEVMVTGSGDPFASRTFRKFLAWVSDETCPKLKILLHTNGLLLTETEWAKYPNLPGKVKSVIVSVDGASKETHELLRRGSRWEVMLKNLPFIGRLRAKGEVGDFHLKFVVQKENFHEMGAFVDLAHEVGANFITFGRLLNWGTFSPEAFADKTVCASSHPQHQEFLRAMADPRLRDPIVLLTSLAEFLPKK